MCTNPAAGEWKQSFSFNEIAGRITNFFNGQQEFLENYRDSFSLTGGEPTISADLPKLIELIDYFQKGVSIKCLTNGRMFAYPEYARSILKSCVHLSLAIPLHSIDGKIHDKITRVQGSFLQTVKGLENIFKYKRSIHNVEIRFVIHALNYTEIHKMAKFIKKEFPGVSKYVVIFFEVEGQAQKNFKLLKISYGDVYPYLESLPLSLIEKPELQLFHFPLCVLPYNLYRCAWRTLPGKDIKFVAACRSCQVKKFCLGVPLFYSKFVGIKEFKAVGASLKIKANANPYNPVKSVKKAYV
jgi:organic radical activating enzyme